MLRKLRQYKTTQRERGFTLIEVMAVVIILGIMAGVATVAIRGRMHSAREKTTKTQISQFESALEIFELNCGFYPSQLEGLISEGATGKKCKGWNGPYLRKKAIPSDPWGGKYNYASPGVRNTNSYDLWSNGADQEEGTDDDIDNWSTDEAEEFDEG